MRSTRGKGKLSFGHALLTSVKSIQSRHLPFVFLTSTTLASHSGYSTSLIAPTWKSLPTSSLITFCLSGAKLFLFCLIGLKDGLRACRDRPGIRCRSFFASWMLCNTLWPRVGLLEPFLLHLWWETLSSCGTRREWPLLR